VILLIQIGCPCPLAIGSIGAMWRKFNGGRTRWKTGGLPPCERKLKWSIETLACIRLGKGSPIGDGLDLITCRMVVEHLDRPAEAFAEVARCLHPGGAFVVITPNLLNYGIFGNAVATKVLPEKLRLRLVHATDAREEKDIFPVRYKANIMRRLGYLLSRSGLQVHKAIRFTPTEGVLQKHPSFERPLMWLTPIYGLLVCAPKVVSAQVHTPIREASSPTGSRAA
jgi:SAM-dependent methyltransferase